MSTRDEILKQALTLAPMDRAFVADALEQSLPIPNNSSSSDISAAWIAEIEGRLQAYERGELPATDADAALQSLREQLAAGRSS